MPMGGRSSQTVLGRRARSLSLSGEPSSWGLRRSRGRTWKIRWKTAPGRFEKYALSLSGSYVVGRTSSAP